MPQQPRGNKDEEKTGSDNSCRSSCPAAAKARKTLKTAARAEVSPAPATTPAKSAKRKFGASLSTSAAKAVVAKVVVIVPRLVPNTQVPMDKDMPVWMSAPAWAETDVLFKFGYLCVAELKAW